MDEQIIAGGIRMSRNVPATMRDGTVLRADVYRPAEPGIYPTILMRVPYNKSIAQSPVYQHPSWYARHGYIVAIQDCRGRFASDGEFDPLRTEAADGFDSIQWAAELPESNGRVGTYGFSYAGATQLLAATQRPPALKCCIPAFTASDYYDGWMYDNGSLNLAFVLTWTVQMLATNDAVRRHGPETARRVLSRVNDFPALFRERPLSQLSLLQDEGVAPYFFDWLEHDTRDEYWQQISLKDRYDDIAVPCLHIGGWYDVFGRGTIENFTELERRAAGDRSREQRLIMGPWIHVPWTPEAAGFGLGESFANRIDEAQLQWFDRWLKDVDAPEEPVVSHFVMGSNEWRETTAWPPPGVRTVDLFLDSSGRANSRTGDGRLLDRPTHRTEHAPDVFVYDPANPVVSAGGSSCCNSDASPMGQACQAGVESRNEVLLYTTDPLQDDLDVQGTPRVHLFAATTAVDTDWVVRLTEVDATGRSVNITQGIVRARFRDSLEHPSFLERNAVVEYCIDMNPTSWRFSRGSRLRLHVTSSDFPAHDANQNIAAVSTRTPDLEGQIAIQSIFHDDDRPSRLELPVAAGFDVRTHRP